MSYLDGIRAVSFDIGGTLIEPYPSVGHVYGEVARAAGCGEFDPALLTNRFGHAWKQKKNFGYSYEDWGSLVDDTFKGLVAQRPSETFFAQLYERFAAPDCWRIYDDVFPTLKRLKQNGVKIAAVSNWDSRLSRVLEGLKLAEYFQVIIASGNSGRHKPDPAIYLDALAQLGEPAQAVLHIGDSLLEDVEGARHAGLSALLLGRDRPTQDGGRIHSLEDLFS